MFGVAPPGQLRTGFTAVYRTARLRTVRGPPQHTMTSFGNQASQRELWATLALWETYDVDLVCLHKHFLAIKNIAGLDGRLEHFRKLDAVRSALQKRGAKVKELTPHDVDERDAVLKLCRLDCHVRADFKLKVERAASDEEAETLFEWLLTAIAEAAEDADEEQEEEMFQEEEIRKVHRLADGSAYQLILTRGRIRSILTATGSEDDESRGRRLAGCLAAACDLGDAEAVGLVSCWRQP